LFRQCFVNGKSWEAEYFTNHHRRIILVNGVLAYGINFATSQSARCGVQWGYKEKLLVDGECLDRQDPLEELNFRRFSTPALLLTCCFSTSAFDFRPFAG
jgi:hypothetical protein